LYAHQAKYHGFYAYDLATLAWGPLLTGMPLVGMLGRSKKSKDGGCAALLGNYIYALKGGNTQEFWRYTTPSGPWLELETVPAFGRTMKEKRVKNGADVTATTDALYALKGNKTNELWRYRPAQYAFRDPLPGRAGAIGLQSDDGRTGVMSTLLLTGGMNLNYSLPAGRRLDLCVIDVAGRTVLARSDIAPCDRLILDLGRRPRGVYFIRLQTGNDTVERKVLLAK